LKGLICVGRRNRTRSLKRAKPYLEPRSRILIVCEDAKSSPRYFMYIRDKLRLHPVEVTVCGRECGSAPINVVDHAIARKRSVKTSPVRDEYDDIFCVIDIDTHTTLDAAINKARDHRLSIILSNPCFEYWYILHFRKTGSAYHASSAVVSDLKNDFPNYDKGNAEIFEAIYPETDTAIERSEEILRSQYHDNEDLRQCNPSTHAHRVVGRLKEVSVM